LSAINCEADPDLPVGLALTHPGQLPVEVRPIGAGAQPQINRVLIDLEIDCATYRHRCRLQRFHARLLALPARCQIDQNLAERLVHRPFERRLAPDNLSGYLRRLTVDHHCPLDIKFQVSPRSRIHHPQLDIGPCHIQPPPDILKRQATADRTPGAVENC